MQTSARKICTSPTLELNQSLFRSFYALTKPTITMLVVFSVLPGMLLSAPAFPSLKLWIAVLFGTALSSASAAVFNQVVDANIDAKMKRTQGRPLPLGRIDVRVALLFGTGLGIAGTALLCAWANPLAAGIALAANIFYVLVYTVILKRLTVQNIVIGGAAGAVGPMIGVAAVSGTLDLVAWMLFALIFLWTPPHFWALALKYKDDYARAKIPMLPVVKGDEVTRRDIYAYSWTLFIPLAVLFWQGHISWFSGVSAFWFTIVFVKKAWMLWRAHNNEYAMPLFHYSCIYLFAVFAVIVLERSILLAMQL